MAESHLQFQQYEYGKNSNLVISGLHTGSTHSEPTGEPEPLTGRIIYSMGDKVVYEKPKELMDDKATHKRNNIIEMKQKRKKSRIDVAKGSTVLNMDVTESATYKPTLSITREIYEQILNKLQRLMGDLPDEALKGAADETLAALKTDNIKDTEKKKNCEEVLGSIDDQLFTTLLQLSKKITDYDKGIKDHTNLKEDADDTTGVGLVFDNDLEHSEYSLSDSESDENSDTDQFNNGAKESNYLASRKLQGDEDVTTGTDKYVLDISKIDSHWLQRELLAIYGDSNMAVATEVEILSILTIPDIQECENKLMLILKYENFEFAKKIRINRWKIYYCTRLGQAQTAEEKENILKQMRMTDEGQYVLEELQSVNSRVSREEELARSVRIEAATLTAKSKINENGNKDKDTYDGTIGHEITEEIDKLKPSRYIDLESIQFTEGDHLMSNTRVHLPDGSQRIEKKSYDEIIVQPYQKPKDLDEERKPISELPSWSQPAFKNLTHLNAIQTKVYPVAFEQYNSNMLVCAPTGAGKTNIALLTILNVLGQFQLKNNQFDLKNFKIVYIAPMKALVAEQVSSLSTRLECFGLCVRELTGDVSLSREQIEETHIIVTTPEKWDIITRRAGERTYTQLVRLIIFDEIHLLHDSRGPVLEAIIARTIRTIETTQEFIRLVGLSATLPNYEDVAHFMRVKPDVGLFYFGNHYRPVPLLQTYIGIKDKKAIKRYNSMNDVTYEKVMENAGKNQVLIFVHSRKETAKTARALRDLALKNDTLARFLQEDSNSRQILQREATETARTNDLKEILPYGFAIHHAGLPRIDRKLVEDLFADRHIQVLVSTATLAWGVNLPAHTVIIKGTQVYKPEKGCWTELSSLDVMQMMGRGGRPQYDSSGHGIIITNHSELQFYLSLNNQQLPVESQMISMLPDILNSEIVLGSVRTRQEAVNWLAYTYLYIRMLKNPQLYNISENEIEEDKLLEQRKTDLVHSALILLDKHNLIKYDRRTGHCQVTALGRVASHYYVKHPTISVFNEYLKPTLSDIELFRLFSLSNEFKHIPIREEEKMELAKLIGNVPIPVKGSAEESCSKVNVLLQAYISRLKLEGFALMSDMVYVQQSAGRIMRALFEISLKRQWANLSRKLLNFCKMIDRRMWGTMTPLRQFKKISDELIRKIESKDFPWSRYYDLSSSQIGEFLGLQPMGSKLIHRYIHTFPRLELNACVHPLARTCLMIELNITPDFYWDPEIHSNSELFWVFVEDVDCEVILHHEVFILKKFDHGAEFTLNFTVPILETPSPNIFIRLVSDRWLQSEYTLAVSFKDLILPEKNPPHTELLDLQPLPVTALRYPEAEALYTTQFKVFDPIQTQVFSTVYGSNENILICAPPASGKDICAEFAILRMMRQDSIRRAVYLAPYEKIAKEKLSIYTHKFGKFLGLTVNELTGEMQTDLKILEQSNLVITTPDKWDYLSRRWKNRKVLQNISLFIVDELQLINSEIGSTLEVCVSRMKYISAQVQSTIRMFGMACSIANAKDVGEWLGAGTNGFFNFNPNVRTAPLEISMHGFEIYHRNSRLLAMSKPVYQAIKHYAFDRPTIIYTPDRKQCRLTAIDLLLQTAADNTPPQFLHTSDEKMDEYINDVREKTLKETLKGGIGYFHEGFTSSERTHIENLFKRGHIQVLVTTENLCWGLNLSSYLVIIMDTKRYTSEGYVDYPIYDVLQMMGTSARPRIDKNGVVVLLCPAHTKEYYKKFISEPLPVESHLDQNLADYINTEIVLKTIENKQDAVDWLTWTFYYRRLNKNPNYYGLKGISQQHLSDHLSELIEKTVATLETSQAISIEDDFDLQPLNLGLIAAFYYIKYTTVEIFNKLLTGNTKRKAILELISNATEYTHISLRSGEEVALENLVHTLAIKSPHKNEYNNPHYKALILLLAHFNRTPLSSDLSIDQSSILETALSLVQAMVDVISSNGWLQPALICMEISQMVVQAMNSTHSPLKQLPHFTDELIQLAKDQNIEDIFDFMNMENDDRTHLLKSLSENEMVDVAQACNRYPVITVDYKIENEGPIAPHTSVVCNIQIERDMMEDVLGPVYAPYFPKVKDEQWWLVVGEPSTNTLTAIKRVCVNKPFSNIKLNFDTPEIRGTHNYVLYLMSDCYMGCDQEYQFDLTVE